MHIDQPADFWSSLTEAVEAKTFVNIIPRRDVVPFGIQLDAIVVCGPPRAITASFWGTSSASSSAAKSTPSSPLSSTAKVTPETASRHGEK
jgi:hypothetical protein